MQLGFVSAILPELSLTEVMTFAAEAGYDCDNALCPLCEAEVDTLDRRILRCVKAEPVRKTFWKTFNHIKADFYSDIFLHP